MQISGETNNLDLYSDARKWCGIPTTDTTTLTLAEFVRSANFGLDRVNSLILKSDGKWQFDDTNQTTELLDVSDSLVSGTQKYDIKITYFKIKRIRIKNRAGNLVILTPVDREQLSSSQLRADAGSPRFYDKLGNYIYLHPKPNYDSSGGLEVQFQRGPSYFIVTDTTKEPGFNSTFHRLISLYGALDYCELNDLESRAAKLRLRIGSPPDIRTGHSGSGMEKEIIDAYSSRDADQKITLRTQREDYGQIALDSNASLNTGRHPDRF